MWFLSANGTNGDRRRGKPNPMDPSDELDCGLFVGLLKGLSILIVLLKLPRLLPPLMLDGAEGRLGVPPADAMADTGEGEGL